MSQNEVVQRIVFRAIESLNQELPDGRKVPVGADTQLLGERATLDSLSLVSVIVDVEAAVENEFGFSVSLTDDRALSQEVSPFSSVSALVSYVVTLLGERG